MASWVLRQAPWLTISRAQFRLDFLSWPLKHHAWSKQYFSCSPLFSQETPAVLDLRKQPYPSTPADSSVFEEEATEYGYGAEGAPTVPRHPDLVLVQLVKNKDYAAAEQVLAEMQELGMKIRRSTLYASVALDLLKRPYRDPYTRLADFTKWWSLTPDIVHRFRTDYSQVQDVIFRQESYPDLPLIIRFSLISASKGHAPLIGGYAVILVTHYAPPSISTQFLAALHQTTLDWIESSDHRNRAQLQERYAKIYRKWYNLAVRQHCMTGRLGEAVMVLQNAHCRGVEIDGYTYHVIRERLTMVEDWTNLSLVDKLQGLDAVSAPETIPAGWVPYRKCESSALANWQFSDETSLLAALRVLRHSITDPLYPSPTALLKFITAYHDCGRSVALGIIRRRSYKHSYLTASLWALSEMLYHHHRQEYVLVLLAFVHHFHLVGVPSWLLRHLSALQLTAKDSSNGTRITPLHPVPQKYWPSSHHTALVWRAVVEINSRSSRAVEGLYQELLAQIETSRKYSTIGPSSAYSSTLVPGPLAPSADVPLAADPYPAPIPLAVSFDDVHFLTFVHVFGHKTKAGPARAARAIVDMYRLGFKPSVACLTTLSAAFAQAGERDQLAALLFRMEQALPTLAPPASGEHTDPAVSVSEDDLPAPNVVTYTAILWELIRARQYVDALPLAKQLMKNMRYVPGTNAVTDRALAVLEACVRKGQHGTSR